MKTRSFLTILKLLLVLGFILLFDGCAAHTNLEPIGQGRYHANASLGGPIVKAFGTRIPVPYSTIGINYGVTGRINANSNLHLMSLAYQIFGIEIGMGWFPLLNQGLKPTLGFHQNFLIMSSFKTGVEERFRAYPVTSVTAAWQTSQGLIYCGCDVISLITKSDYDNRAPSFMISPFIGYRWRLNQNYYLLTELKYHGINIQTNQLAVEYLALKQRGALAPFISLERRF